MDDIKDMIYIKMLGEAAEIVQKIEEVLPKLSADQIEAIGKAKDELAVTLNDARNKLDTCVHGFRGHLDSLQSHVDKVAGTLLDAAADLKRASESAVDETSKAASQKVVSDINAVAERIKADMVVAARSAASMAVVEGVAGALTQVVTSAKNDIERTTKEFSASIDSARDRIDSGASKVNGLAGRLILMCAGAAFVAGLLGAGLATIYANDSMGRALVSRVTSAAAEAAGKNPSEQAYDAYNSQQERTARLRSRQSQER